MTPTSARLVAAVAATLATLALPGAPATAQQPPPRTLADMVRRAVEVHPSVEAAREAATAAGAGVAAARAAFLPELAVQGSAVRFQEAMVVAPIHGFDPTNAPDFDETLMQGSLGLSYTIFDGGRRSAEARQARAGAAASQADLAEARAALIQRTTQAYLALLTARDLVASRAALERALTEERDRAQRFLDEGAAPRVDLLRVEAELAAAQAGSADARRALDMAASALGHLLDEDPRVLADTPLTTPTPPASRAPASPPPAGPPAAQTRGSSATDASPRVAAALRAAESAEAGLAAARSAWLPRLQATGGYSVFGGAESSTTGEWQAGIRVSYPLFTDGSRRAATDAAGARARAARAGVELVREEVALAADRARTDEEEARARVASLEAAVARYEELVRVERLALAEGSGVQSDFLRAVAALEQARAGLARARHDVLDARVAGARALGSLTVDWIEDFMEERR